MENTRTELSALEKLEKRRAYIREYSRRFRENNPEKWKETYTKSYRKRSQQHREKWNAARRYKRVTNEEARSRELKYYHNNKERCLRTKLMRVYGITPEMKEEMLKKQSNACAVCKSETPGQRGWHIDHDHACCVGPKSCGKCIRGILCGNCNVALGLLKDDVNRVNNLITYLENSPKIGGACGGIQRSD